MMNKPLVSICCITFNHEEFIRDTISGFLSQVVDFEIEILIHDDASTDHTAHVIQEFEKKHPGLIKPIYQTENQWSKGIRASPTYLWPKAKGKYIALCEGDDYWTDPSKLQQQVDLLESNSDYIISCHNVLERRDQELNLFNSEGKIVKEEFQIEDLFSPWFIPTGSVVFRKPPVIVLPDWYLNSPHGDLGLYFTLMRNGGKIHYNDTPMAVYRRHPGGVSSRFTKGKLILSLSYLYTCVNISFDNKYTDAATAGIEEIVDLMNADKYLRVLSDPQKIASVTPFRGLMKALIIKMRVYLRKIGLRLSRKTST